MAISFQSLIACYLGLLVTGFVGRSRAERMVTLPRGPIVTGTAVVAGVVVAGILQLQSWPFAIYPQFNYLAGPTITQGSLTAYDPEGREVQLPLARIREQMLDGRWSAILDRVAFLEE